MRGDGQLIRMPTDFAIVPSKPLPISVCMIAGAEAARIGRSLAAVADWVTDIHVVLNDDVADGTDEIAPATWSHRSP